jgi:hypothetical protein
MLELEKKWLLKRVPDFESHSFEIVAAEEYLQSYLSKSERLRRIYDILTNDGTVIYQHFTKEKVGPGTSIEAHRTLDEEEYEELHHRAVRELTKARLTVRDPETGYVYELDEFDFNPPHVRILMLEIEFQDKYTTIEEVDYNFRLPSFVQDCVLADVTGLDSCSNWALAQEIGEQE